MEKQAKYDGIIIMGRSWRGYPFKFRPFRNSLDIHPLSKINTIVAADMYLNGLTKKIIFGTGKTAGKKWPSEAKAIKDYILRKNPTIKEEDILIHEKNLDTYEELEKDLELAKENNLEKLAIITVDTQLPRCKKVLGDRVDYISSEEEIQKKSHHYKNIIGRYHKSLAFKYEYLKECILIGLHRIGVSKNTFKYIAKLLRE